MVSREAIRRRIEELEEKTQSRKIPKFEFVVDNERYERLDKEEREGVRRELDGPPDKITFVFGVEGGE